MRVVSIFSPKSASKQINVLPKMSDYVFKHTTKNFDACLSMHIVIPNVSCGFGIIGNILFYYLMMCQEYNIC